MVNQIRELTGVEARAVPEASDKWKVLVRSESPEAADELPGEVLRLGGAAALLDDSGNEFVHRELVKILKPLG